MLWLAPLAFGLSGMRNAMTTMLLEFIVIHAGGFLGTLVLAASLPKRTRLLGAAALAAVYAVLVAGCVLFAKQWWPAVAVAWLLCGKVVDVLADRTPSAATSQRQVHLWAMSVLFYILALAATLLLPVPALGLQPDIVAALALDAGGLWNDAPQRAIAFGALYFGLMAWVRYAMR